MIKIANFLLTPTTGKSRVFDVEETFESEDEFGLPKTSTRRVGYSMQPESVLTELAHRHAQSKIQEGVVIEFSEYVALVRDGYEMIKTALYGLA